MAEAAVRRHRFARATPSTLPTGPRAARHPQDRPEHRPATYPDDAASTPGTGFDVLVLDAASRQSLAVTRSLGRAGLAVAVGECFAECDPDLPVPAFRSRHSAGNVTLTSFADDPSGFAHDVAAFVRRHPTRVVIPTSDGAISALLPWRERLLALGAVLALPSDDALAVANDKEQTLAIAAELGIHVPRSMLVAEPADLPRALDRLALPVVVKPTRSWPEHGHARVNAAPVIDEREAAAVVAAFHRDGLPVLVQEWIGGPRVGVTLFVSDGQVRASFAHLEHRTTPLIGGVSVLREGTAVPADLLEPAVALARRIGLDGLFEVEFRRDLGGRPFLMEVNARVAGTLEIAVRSGVDFPALLWQWATGAPVQDQPAGRPGVRMRWLRGDLRWLRQAFAAHGRPESLSRTAALLAFLTEFARPTSYDYFDRTDLRPFLAELRTTVDGIHRTTRPGRTPPPGTGRSNS